MNDNLETADIARIMELLPHRYPFLLIDKVVNIINGERAIGIKNVTINEPFFQGHFPKKPIMPGVLLVEAMAQTAGVLSLNNQPVNENNLVYFMTIDQAKFRKPVVPGDKVEFHVELINQKRNICKYQAKAIVEGKVVAQAEIGAMLDAQS